VKPKRVLLAALAAIFLWHFIQLASPQSSPVPGTLNGTVVYGYDGAPIRMTSIWIHEQLGKANFATQADSSGSFSIQLPAGHYFVLVGSPGFAPYSTTVWIKAGKLKKLAVRLRADSAILQNN